MPTPVLILHAPGTNRDREAAWAIELCGGAPEIVPLAALADGRRHFRDYAMVVLPGGFSYGDDLGAGRIWATEMRYRLGEPLGRFVESGRPVLGICNGFQTLVKAGLLPGPGDAQTATLCRNASDRFECRWVRLQADPQSPCVFTRALDEPLLCPVAHGEGRFVTPDLPTLEARGQVALRYVARDGGPAGYPDNPNGSAGGVAGICNPAGNVLGLMPHPEDHVIAAQHPRAHRGERGGLGLHLFQAGVRYAAGSM